MMRCFVFLVVVCVFQASADEEFIRQWKNTLSTIAANPRLRDEMNKAIQKDAKNTGFPIPPFTCEVEKSPEVPTSVHKLRPADINVVAVVGDSISTGCGCGAKNIFEVIDNNRGCAYTGGADGVLANKSTIPNVLRKFNPDLKGAAVGEGDIYDANSWLNVAVMGARAIHLPDQVDDLIDKMQRDPRIDVENDWKLVNVFIGGNDMCGYCRDRPGRTPEKFAGYIQDAIDQLHQKIPHTLVQVIPLFDVSPLRFMRPNPAWICEIMQYNFCSCAIDNDTRPELKPLQMGYFNATKDMVMSGRFDTKDDFTVVLQPTLRDAKPAIDPATGDIDHSLVSYDCFHPSAKMHGAMGIGVWNNMLQRVGHKKHDLKDSDVTEIACPTKENPYIFTNKNSGSHVGESQGSEENSDEEIEIDVNKKNDSIYQDKKAINAANQKCVRNRIIIVSSIGGVALALVVLFVVVLPVRRRLLKKAAAKRVVDEAAAEVKEKDVNAHNNPVFIKEAA